MIKLRAFFLFIVIIPIVLSILLGWGFTILSCLFALMVSSVDSAMDEFCDPYGNGIPMYLWISIGVAGILVGIIGIKMGITKCPYEIFCPSLCSIIGAILGRIEWL